LQGIIIPQVQEKNGEDLGYTSPNPKTPMRSSSSSFSPARKKIQQLNCFQINPSGNVLGKQSGKGIGNYYISCSIVMKGFLLL
jgi:hypothetical protein